MRLSGWVGALGERNFLLFFVGQSASQIGSGMAPVAVSFAVLEHGSASDVGYVAAAGLVPVVLLLLAGGVLADRMSRRVLMLGSDSLRALAEIALGWWILTQAPPLWGFMLLAALVGAGQAFFSPAMTGMVPHVISATKLQQANALNGLSSSVGGIIGPPLAGVIIAVANPGWAVVIDGVTYLLSVLSLSLIKVAWLPLNGSDSFARQLRAGWHEFWSRTWLWVIVVEFSIVNILIFAPMFVLGPVVAKQSLGGAPAWGLILAFEGVGALVGGVAMLRYHPRRPLLVATLSPIAWVWPLLGLAYRAPVLVIASGAFVAGIGIAVFSTLWVTTMQREMPSDILSRVSAYDWFGSLVFLPIGMALIGPVDRAVGLKPTIVGAAVLLIVFIGATLTVPSVICMRGPIRPART